MKKKKIELNKAEGKALSLSEQKSLLDGNLPDKEERIRTRYSKNPPCEEIQRYVIKTNNILAIEVISERWDLNNDVAKQLIRTGTVEAKAAYTENRKFVKSIEPEYAKSATLPELMIYFARYKQNMNKKAYNICVGVKKIDRNTSYVPEKKKKAEKVKETTPNPVQEDINISKTNDDGILVL